MRSETTRRDRLLGNAAYRPLHGYFGKRLVRRLVRPNTHQTPQRSADARQARRHTTGVSQPPCATNPRFPAWTPVPAKRPSRQRHRTDACAPGLYGSRQGGGPGRRRASPYAPRRHAAVQPTLHDRLSAFHPLELRLGNGYRVVSRQPLSTSSTRPRTCCRAVSRWTPDISGPS